MSIGEHRHCLRNIQNIRICIGKKPIVSVRISKALGGPPWVGVCVPLALGWSYIPETLLTQERRHPRRSFLLDSTEFLSPLLCFVIAFNFARFH